MFDSLLSGMGGGGAGGGKEFSSATSTSSIDFARGREGTVPTPEWMPVALAAIGGALLLVVLWLLTKR